MLTAAENAINILELIGPIQPLARAECRALSICDGLAAHAPTPPNVSDHDTRGTYQFADCSRAEMELSEARAACDDAMNKRTLQLLSGYGGEE